MDQLCRVPVQLSIDWLICSTLTQTRDGCPPGRSTVTLKTCLLLRICTNLATSEAGRKGSSLVAASTAWTTPEAAVTRCDNRCRKSWRILAILRCRFATASFAFSRFLLPTLRRDNLRWARRKALSDCFNGCGAVTFSMVPSVADTGENAGQPGRTARLSRWPCRSIDAGARREQGRWFLSPHPLPAFGGFTWTTPAAAKPVRQLVQEVLADTCHPAVSLRYG